MALNNLITALDMIKSTKYLDFLDYHKIADSQKEFIRSDMWQLEFIQYPRVVYYPGNDLINQRLISVVPTTQGSVTDLSQIVRGFKVHQTGAVSTSGSLALTFGDREDQAITMFVEDWKNKAMDPDKRYSFRKEDLMAQIGITMFNTSRVPIRKLTFYACIIADRGIQENFTGDEGATNLSEVTLNLNFEHHKRELLNM